MKLLSKFAAVMMIAAGIAGCTGANTDKNPEFQLKMDQTSFSLKQWKMDGSHRSGVGGTFMSGDQPVANAILRAGEGKRDIRTAADGSFEILLDHSLLGQMTVRPVSLDEATIGGEPLTKEQTSSGMAASASMQIQYPVVVESAGVDPNDPATTVVHGRLQADQTASVAYFQEDKFRIAGIVKDADGKPVQGAVVWIDRDGGEGFAKSNPTDADGKYAMYYLPEDDEETNLSVTIKSVKYTLPANKVYRFPEDTSLNIDITLPREGTVIDDQPPALVSKTAPGALYAGVLVGLDTDKGTEYKVTIPDAEGRFTLYVPTEAWEKNPTFFEAHMTKFIDQNSLPPGTAVPSDFIEKSKDAPGGIAAIRQSE